MSSPNTPFITDSSTSDNSVSRSPTRCTGFLRGSSGGVDVVGVCLGAGLVCTVGTGAFELVGLLLLCAGRDVARI